MSLNELGEKSQTTIILGKFVNNPQSNSHWFIVFTTFFLLVKKSTFTLHELHSVFLFCSIIITQLLSISSKSELQFASFIHTLALNFKDWTFGVIVTRHFRPKSGLLNEIVYCKPIDRTLKMLFIERSGSFLRPTISELLKLLVSIYKKNKYNGTLKIFSSENKSFHNLHKISKSTVLNAMAVHLC